MKKQCKTCKHWKRLEGDDEKLKKLTEDSNIFTRECKATEGDDGIEIDMSGTYNEYLEVTLYFPATFGCILHEPLE